MPDSGTRGFEPAVAAALDRFRGRFRLEALAAAVILGAAGAALVLMTAPTATSTSAAPVVFLLISGTAGSLWWRHWTHARVAAAVERRIARFDNLLITAEEVLRGNVPRLRPALREAVFRAVDERLDGLSPSTVQPVAAIVAVGVGAVLAVFALGMRTALTGGLPPAGSDAAMPATSPHDLRVVVSPPSYTDRPATVEINPAIVTAVEGSRVTLDTPESGESIALVEPDGRAVLFSASSGQPRHALTATSSRPLLVRFSDRADGETRFERLVQLRVEPDRRPVVTITAPGKDLLFPDGQGRVEVAIEARDDIALQSLALRYTRMTGSGEGFSFAEGELPVQIEPSGSAMWKARASIALSALKLEDGDALVYRAVATDRKPGADPAASESFLIEIGRLSPAVSTGFALPDDRDRQGLSQQMLILKTERLHAERSVLAPDAFAEQSRLLAMEQRMVRAEFVFMTGGEVEDEVEEAAHSDALVEGRFENQGQIDLLVAIREMSRAEGRLNAHDTAQALVYERAALKALQRAFDRRRYLLRTLPERARIDPSRRLSGPLTDARSSEASVTPAAADPVVERARRALIALGALDAMTPNARAASQVLEVDPSSENVQAAAARLVAARTEDESRVARQFAQRTLATLMRARLGSPARSRVVAEPLLGRVADELARTQGRK